MFWEDVSYVCFLLILCCFRAASFSGYGRYSYESSDCSGSPVTAWWTAFDICYEESIPYNPYTNWKSYRSLSAWRYYVCYYDAKEDCEEDRNDNRCSATTYDLSECQSSGFGGTSHYKISSLLTWHSKLRELMSDDAISIIQFAAPDPLSSQPEQGICPDDRVVSVHYSESSVSQEAGWTGQECEVPLSLTSGGCISTAAFMTLCVNGTPFWSNPTQAMRIRSGPQTPDEFAWAEVAERQRTKRTIVSVSVSVPIVSVLCVIILIVILIVVVCCVRKTREEKELERVVENAQRGRDEAEMSVSISMEGSQKEDGAFSVSMEETQTDLDQGIEVAAAAATSHSHPTKTEVELTACIVPDTVVCPSCGETRVGAGRFCSGCGHSFVEQSLDAGTKEPTAPDDVVGRGEQPDYF